MSGLDKALISAMMESFVNEAPPTPFVSYCVVCKVFLTEDEMMYKKGLVFHKDCFDQHGKEFPEVDQDLINQNSNAKIQLVQLKNLKVRQLGSSDQSSSSPKPKRKTAKKRRSSSKRKKAKKRSSKKRTSAKRRAATNRRKKPRKSARKSRRLVRRRPSRRRTSRRKTKRRR